MTRTVHPRAEDMIREAAPDIHAYLARRVGPDDAADLLGEALLVAWRRVDDAPLDGERMRMWLFGIARGTLLNHGRSERRRRALTVRVRDSAGDRFSPGADIGLEVRDAIDRLAPNLAEVVRLVHWEGLSLVQVAELVGIPAATARGRYRRAREQLRIALMPD